MDFRQKISMVYYIASKMGKHVDYPKAQVMAMHFSAKELKRLFVIAGKWFMLDKLIIYGMIGIGTVSIIEAFYILFEISRVFG